MNDGIAHAEQVGVADVGDKTLDTLSNRKRGVDLDLGEVWEGFGLPI